MQIIIFHMQVLYLKQMMSSLIFVQNEKQSL